MLLPLALALQLQLPAVHIDTAAYLAAQLTTRGGNPVTAFAVADALMQYSREHAIDPVLAAAVVTVENYRLNATARNPKSGATGIMQVMPFWKRYIKGCGTKLTEVRTNVCFGMQILAWNLKAAKTRRGALLRYNGCRGGAHCRQYPTIVLQHAETFKLDG